MVTMDQDGVEFFFLKKLTKAPPFFEFNYCINPVIFSNFVTIFEVFKGFYIILDTLTALEVQ
jgi:hypothetical protein